MELRKTLKLSDIVESNNVADMMDEDDLAALGSLCVQEYQADKDSRREWEERSADAIRMAMQIPEEKSFPWAGAANVKFPLTTIAALQFHARAYPATIPGPDVVGCRVIGDDPDNTKQARADRVSAHMSFQRMEQDTQWEESHDKLLIIAGLVGCAFKKTYHDSINDIQVSELVMPNHLVVDYYTKSLETANRITHSMERSTNYFIERERAKLFLKTDLKHNAPHPLGELDRVKDEGQGTRPGGLIDDAPLILLEQHRWMDLDGDGYKEPYIVSVREDTMEVCRVVARFYKEGIIYNEDGDLQRIQPEHFFTKFPFIPSPDGGFYDMGFGTLLGALNEAINTVINQLLDAGTMATTAGGFLGRGIQIKGGDYSFKPNEWKRVDNNGTALRDCIFPLPVREPSNVLFQLLGLLIDFGTKIGMATDALVGENPGQNTPAETSRNTITQGEKVFNGIYKRIYRAMKEEFRKCYRLNYFNAPLNGKFEYTSTDGKGAFATVEDYFDSDNSVIPTADPYVVSDDAKMAQAVAVKNSAQSTSGYDKYVVERRFLKALKVQGIDQIFPDPKGPKAVAPLPNPKLQIEQMNLEDKKADRKSKDMKMLLTIQEQAKLNDAKVLKMQAEAKKITEETTGINKAHELALMEARIAETKGHQQNLIQLMDQLKETNANDAAGMGQPNQ